MSHAETFLAALAAFSRLVVGRLAERDVGTGADRSLSAIAAVESLAGHDSVDFFMLDGPLVFALNRASCLHDKSPTRHLRTGENVLESKLNVAGIQGRSFDE